MIYYQGHTESQRWLSDEITVLTERSFCVPARWQPGQHNTRVFTFSAVANRNYLAEGVCRYRKQQQAASVGHWPLLTLADPAGSRHADAPLRPRQREGWPRGTTRWSRSSRRFLFSAGYPGNPLLSVMLRFRFPAARRITERRPVVGVMCRWCALGGEEEGVSIVTPRQ